MQQLSQKPRRNFFFRKYGKLKRKAMIYYNAWFLGDIFPFEVKRWFRDKGDETLRLDYALNENSVVFDVGGYVGDFADSIFERYQCNIYVFEPSKEFYATCVTRFGGNPKIKCFNYGLADVDGTFFLSERADGSSIKSERHSENVSSVEVRKFSNIFQELDIQRIDLLKINIEGGEYDLLPHIIKEGLAGKILNIQVQFHNFISNAKSMRGDIISQLKITHRCTWSYVFVWENWVLRTTNVS